MPAGRTVFGKSKKVVLYPGVDHITGVSSPLYDGRSFTVNAEVELKGTEEGVVFAVGGEKSGISLFVLEGKLHLAHKVNGQVNHLVADTTLPHGKATLGFSYQLTGSKEGILGTESILINGNPVVKRELVKGGVAITANNRADGTDIGRDQRYPVSEKYSVPFAFKGKLKRVVIDYL